MALENLIVFCCRAFFRTIIPFIVPLKHKQLLFTVYKICYLQGHKVSKAYIATQGPKAVTLNDFWRMIWENNVKHIANLANIYEGGKVNKTTYIVI